MELLRVSDGVYYSTKDDYYDQPCLYAVVGSRRTLMVDGGVTPDRAREFVSLLRRETGRGADFAAVTHWHWDHTFGLPGIDAPVLACVETARHIARMAGYSSWSDEALEARICSGEEIGACAENIRKNYPGGARSRISLRSPDILFDGLLELDLGGLTCRLTQLPPVHTNDGVAIHVPERNVLILGDAMYANCYDKPAHYCAQPVLDLISFIRGTGADMLLVSHMEPETAEELRQYNGMLETAARGVISGITGTDELLGHMRRTLGGCLLEDACEIAGLFVAGIEYDRIAGR